MWHQAEAKELKTPPPPPPPPPPPGLRVVLKPATGLLLPNDKTSEVVGCHVPSKQGCNCHFLACFHCSAGDIIVRSGDLTNLLACKERH